MSLAWVQVAARVKVVSQPHQNESSLCDAAAITALKLSRIGRLLSAHSGHMTYGNRVAASTSISVSQARLSQLILWLVALDHDQCQIVSPR